jgi:hypothetical protein
MDSCLQELIRGPSNWLCADKVITESFFMNPKLRTGMSVIPTINGFIEKSCAEHKVDYAEVSPSTWRKQLDIKFIKDSKGKRDYKTPTKEEVENIIGKLPAEIESNITRKMRATPHDVWDVLAITISEARQQGIEKVEISNSCFLPLTIIEKFNIIVRSI